MEEKDEKLIDHIEALRKTLLSCLAAVAVAAPCCYWAAPRVIDAIVQYCLTPETGELHYFAPMEVFWIQLKLSLILALIVTYPWNAWQIWRFLLPALHLKERLLLGRWVVASSILFLAGAAFSLGLVMPMLMRFSATFATPELKPMLGLGDFLGLAGWLTLAFAIMFQTPVAVLLAVRFGIISARTLAAKRPYAVVSILVLAAILTPPDVVSQLMLALPTWLLFETGVLLAKRCEYHGS